MGSAKKNRILIVSDEFDPHVDQMVVLLGELGVACTRWVPSSYPTGSSISIVGDGGAFSCSIKSPRLLVDFETVRSVWYRHPGPSKRPEGLSEDESRFAAIEVRSALAGMYQLSECFWVNHPDRIRIAESKPLQLKLAAELGFRIPRTLVTNDPEEVRRFSAENPGGIIYKPLNSGFILSRQWLCYTRSLSARDLEQIDLIRNAPGIFQENIRKKVELRVTIIGEHVFATEIHSQALAEGKDDWRQASVEALPHFPHTLPKEIEDFCKAFLDRCGLVYGAMDMIVDPRGEYVFLENNPSGQFGWIEGKTGVPLTATLAKMLIAGKRI